MFIYKGAAWALDLRRRWGAEQTPFIAELDEFVCHHRETEREHLLLLNHILRHGVGERSRLLPVWRAAVRTQLGRREPCSA